MNIDQLQCGFLRLVKELYSAEQTAARRRNFKQRLRHSANFATRRKPYLIQVKALDLIAE